MNEILKTCCVLAAVLLINLFCVLPLAAEELADDFPYWVTSEIESDDVPSGSVSFSPVSRLPVFSRSGGYQYPAKTSAPSSRPGYVKTASGGYTSSVIKPTASPRPAFTRMNYNSHSAKAPLVTSLPGSIRVPSSPYANGAKNPTPSPRPSSIWKYSPNYPNVPKTPSSTPKPSPTENAVTDPPIMILPPIIADDPPAATAVPENPGGLPTDNTLCLVGLGYQLNPDGSMQPELIGRLQVLKHAAEMYPQAIIAVTGGHTASNNPSVSEAGQMAIWLMDNGVDPTRIVVESNSMTTQENAAYTLDLLSLSQSQITSIAIITSDYHMDTGVDLFRSQAFRMGKPIDVTAGEAFIT